MPPAAVPRLTAWSLLEDGRPFDLIVVGGGFYGVTTAWDAAQRGLSVAIIDRDDFGAATSFNNLKTLHGGLRSLQSLNLSQMRLFIRERRQYWNTIFKGLNVQPE